MPYRGYELLYFLCLLLLSPDISGCFFVAINSYIFLCFFAAIIFQIECFLGLNSTMNNIKELCDLIRETSFAIHTYLKFGHMEKVYENALLHRLQKTDIHVQQQYPIKIYDEDNTILGEYFADLFIENCLLVELKACKTLAEEHTAQLLGYLRASKIEHGLLVNFGAPRLQIKKFILDRIDK